MRRPSARTVKVLGFAVIPASVLLTGLLVTASSYSVLSATTSSPGNSWSTGSVALTNDSNGSSQAVSGGALFSSANSAGLKPGGAAVQECVTVRSTGSLAAPVKLYTQNPTSTNSLPTYLNLTVEVGTATSTTGGACTGFSASSTIYPTASLAGFQAAYTNYGNGLATTWTTTGTPPETKVFRFTVQPSSGMTNTQQGSTASVDFVWEADNS